MGGERRILYISYDCITEPLTTSQVLPYLEGLSSQNEIFLLTFNKKKVERRRLANIAARYGLKRIYALRYHKWPSLPATAFDILCGIAMALVIVKNHGISLVHARSYVACAAAFAVRRLTGVEYIFDVRGLLADERVDSTDWGRSSISYKVVKFWEKAMLKEARAIVILSRRGVDIVKDIMGKDCPEDARHPVNISVIPTCVDMNLFDPRRYARSKEGDGSLNIIYIGSLGTWYMMAEMLDFFKAVRETAAKARFLILTHSNAAPLFALAAERGLDRGSIDVRSEPHETVPLYLKASDASVFFIRPTFSKLVSCPTKFAESLSMGVPVVVNQGIGDIDGFIRRCSVGVVVDDFRKENYRKAVLQLMDILKDKDSLAERCRKLAANEFSLESAVRKYNEIYRSAG